MQHATQLRDRAFCGRHDTFCARFLPERIRSVPPADLYLFSVRLSIDFDYYYPRFYSHRAFSTSFQPLYLWQVLLSLRSCCYRYIFCSILDLRDNGRLTAAYRALKYTRKINLHRFLGIYGFYVYALLVKYAAMLLWNRLYDKGCFG